MSPAHDRPLFADPKADLPFKNAFGTVEREKMAVQDYRGGLSYAERKGREEGREEGLAEGEARGLRLAVLDLAELLGLPIDPPRRARIDDASAQELDALRSHLKRRRAWPAGE